MEKSLYRTDRDIEALYMRHHLMLYRVCYSFLKNRADTEDAVSETFIRLIRKQPAFESEKHETAWLVMTAENICRSMLKHWWRRQKEDIDDFFDLSVPDNAKAKRVLEAVLALPPKYKTVVYMYYYEGYSTNEIAEMLKRKPSTVRNDLHDARVLLKERSGDDFYEG